MGVQQLPAVLEWAALGRLAFQQVKQHCCYLQQASTPPHLLIHSQQQQQQQQKSHLLLHHHARHLRPCAGQTLGLPLPSLPLQL